MAAHEAENERPVKAAKLTDPSESSSGAALQHKWLDIAPWALGEIILLQVTGCSNLLVSKVIQGTYKSVGSNQDKPVYEKMGDTIASLGSLRPCIYYSDQGSDRAWCLGSNVEAGIVWFFNPNLAIENPLEPPTDGWRLPNGPQDRRLRIMTIGQYSNITELVDALSQAQENSRQCEKLLAVEREKLQDAEKKIQEMQEEKEQLSAHLEEQRRVSSIAGSNAACWKYLENGNWHAVPPEANDQMHQAYLAYLRNPSPYNRYVTINSAGVARYIDFQTMKQVRLDTKMVRKIQIFPGVPAQWVTTPARLLQQTDELKSFFVKVTDPHIQDTVREILRFTGHGQDSSQICSLLCNAEVKSVHRVENWRLWQGYKLRREALRKEHASYNVLVAPAALDLDAFDAGHGKVMTSNQKVFDCGEALAADVDEKILLHGTSRENANSIAVNGFDHRTCDRGMYGDGVYFASAACKSHQYTCPNHDLACGCRRKRILIIARVALGDSYHTKETRINTRRPPVRNSTTGVTYDSVVVNPGPIKGHHNTTQVHQEFVVCDREQAYPCYVVEYRV